MPLKRLTIILLFLLCLGCVSSNNSIKNIKCSEIKEIIDSDGILIDVRSLEEYNVYHLDNAINIDINNIDDIQNEYPNKDKKIIVYCQSGSRSSKAATYLKQLGYKNVYDLGSINNCPN